MEWISGNAVEDGAGTRGWLVGHFAPAGVRRSHEVEVKWADHPAGDRRTGWAPGDARTTITMLVSGQFRIDGPGGSVVMERPGDYVMWEPGTGHSWEALADSTVVTVRWPSLPG